MCLTIQSFPEHRKKRKVEFCRRTCSDWEDKAFRRLLALLKVAVQIRDQVSIDVQQRVAGSSRGGLIARFGRHCDLRSAHAVGFT